MAMLNASSSNRVKIDMDTFLRELQEAKLNASSSNHVKIDVDTFLREKEKSYVEEGGSELQEPFIMEVPIIFKSTDEKQRDFIPQMVGLGPYHHNSGSMMTQHTYKMEALIRALKRMRMQARKEDHHNPEPELRMHLKKELDDLRKTINDMKGDIICCYASDFEFNADMFILDGCFVLETMLTAASVMSKFDDHYTNWSTDRKFFNQRLSPVVWESLCLDFIKLENQLPFIVIEELMKIQGLEKKLPDILLGLYTVVSPLPSNFIKREDIKKMINKPKVCEKPISRSRVAPEDQHPNMLGRPGHFLDGLLQFTLSYILGKRVSDVFTIRIKHVNSSVPQEPAEGENVNSSVPQEPAEGENVNSSIPQEPAEGKNVCTPLVKALYGEPPIFDRLSLPTATELKRVNIKVKRGGCVDVKERCLDLFTTLTMPALLVKEHTPVVLQNLILHELCPAVYGNTLTNYVTMIDNLINSKEDVECLKEGGVIDGTYGSDERLADVFNTLARTMASEYKGEMRKSVRRIRHLHSQKMRTLFMEFYAQYLSRPWLVIATLAAIVVLVCTVIQTISK